MRILLVNDDGIHSSWLRLLAEELGKSHSVIAVVPDGNRSAVSHGITMRVPILVNEEHIDGCEKAFSVSGNPADCTRLALGGLIEEPIDLVISGPNVGLNVSFDILYSGTAAGALEAAMWGKKAIAVSGHHTARAEDVVEIFLRVLEQLDIEKDIHHVLNVNIPALPKAQIKGVKWVSQGLFHQWNDHYERRVAPGGQEYYWIDGCEIPLPPDETDSCAVTDGYVSLTPITFSLTDPEGFSGRSFKL